MSGALLDRRTVVARLLADRGDALVISSLGAPTFDVLATDDSPHNFYFWGAMGGATALGLGLALAQPQRPVIVVTGDGELLMGIGTLATVAVQRPGNLSILVLDNERYGETGGQRTHTSFGADLAMIARGCGIAEVETVTDLAAVDRISTRACRLGDQPMIAVVKIDPAEAPKIIRHRDGAVNRGAFRAALGLSAD